MIAAAFPDALAPACPPSPPRLREVTAVELSVGVWLLSIESKSQPGLSHEVRVTHGEAGPCDCTAAGFRLDCHHRRDAADLAKSLDLFYASLAGVRDIQECWQSHYYPGIAGALAAERDRLEFARRCVKGMGYRIAKAVTCDGR